MARKERMGPGLCVLVLAAAVSAGDAAREAAQREELRQIQEKVDVLARQQKALLDREVADYLATQRATAAADGATSLVEIRRTQAAVTVDAKFLESLPDRGLGFGTLLAAVAQTTVGNDPADRAVVDGKVDLDMHLKITDTLSGRLWLTANNMGDGTFDWALGPFDSHPAIGGHTAGGLIDGIGLNGLAPTRKGSVTVQEAGVRYVCRRVEGFGWEMGLIDPRTRFGQTRYDDAHRYFLLNGVADQSSVPFLTTADGRDVLGLRLDYRWGEGGRWKASSAWFNTPGEFFDNGQYYLQLEHTWDVGGGALDARAFGYIDNHFEHEARRDSAAGGGIALEWTKERLGLFLKLSANGSDANPVEFDAALGAVVKGVAPSRPDDHLNLALTGALLRDTMDPYAWRGPFTFESDYEMAFEGSYTFHVDDHIAITPGIIFISDVGGGVGWTDDTLWVFSTRFVFDF